MNKMDLKSKIACRLRAETRGNKTLLLQMIPVEYAFAIIAAAFECGWKIVLVREDASQKFLQEIDKKINDYLKMYRDNSPTIYVQYHSEQLSFESWLEKNAVEGRPYVWQKTETALILFSSGSTGTPKGVCHSFENIKQSVHVFIKHFKLQKNDVLCSMAPLHTTTGIRSLMIPLFHKINVVCLPQNQQEAFLSWIERVIQSEPTLIFCGPMVIKLLARYGTKLVGAFLKLRAFLSGGDILNEDDRQALQKLHGVPVLNIYGSTEACGAVLAEDFQIQCVNSLPPPVAGAQLLFSPLDEKQGLYQLGYTLPHLYIGYLGEPLSCKTQFFSDDIVKKVSNGQLKWMGRISNVLKGNNQEWIFPTLLEQFLKKISTVKDVVVEASNPLRVWIETDLMRDDILQNCHAAIIQELGIEYGNIEWNLAKIIRTAQGKLEKIISN